MDVDGFINLNKDLGITSQKAVAAIKRLLQTKAGHCGTLDPLASGVLPICLGRATRLSDIVMGQKKTYIGEICFGEATDSYDQDGTVTANADASSLTEQDILAVLPRFTGDIEQIPPAISAIKQNGVPLYKRARRGEAVELSPRQVHIDEIFLLDFTPGEKAFAKIQVACAKGTYIRSLAVDIGAACGLPAHLSSLVREKTGSFELGESYTLEQVEHMVAEQDYSFIIPINKALTDLPIIVAKQEELVLISHGNPISRKTGLAAGCQVAIQDSNSAFLALATVHEDKEDQVIKMNKVFVEPLNRISCAIGNFDGLHLGHRALFEELHRQKQLTGSKSVVLTFSPHPLSVIRGKTPPLLTENKLKIMLMREYFDIDKVITLDFDRRIMNISPEEFVENYIVRELKAQHIVVGFDFTFAAHGAGTAHLLAEICQDYGIQVTIIGEEDQSLQEISSTNIRQSLVKGQLDDANAMLGYWFVMAGKVVRGNRIGHSIGYPTANFRPSADQAAIPNGVYAARIEHQGITYDGVVNFGYKPTIGGEVLPLVEAHLFDVDICMYDDTIRVWLGKYLRAEKRFTGLPELKEQIAKDSLLAREFLSDVPKNNHLPKRIG